MPLMKLRGVFGEEITRSHGLDDEVVSREWRRKNLYDVTTLLRSDEPRGSRRRCMLSPIELSIVVLILCL